MSPGEATAQCWLGACCASGRGVPKDSAAAVRWYTLAAEQGHARAQSNLAMCLSQGTGVQMDKDAALRWCAQTQNLKLAQARLHKKTEAFRLRLHQAAKIVI